MFLQELMVPREDIGTNDLGVCRQRNGYRIEVHTDHLSMGADYLRREKQPRAGGTP
jgi:hypothetical protein